MIQLGPIRTDRMGRWVPFALSAVILIPTVAGTLRLVELSSGPQLKPEDSRLTASPVPVVVHISRAIPYAVIGAYQFSPWLRRRHPKWHRMAGRALLPLGLAVAFTALWMTLFYAGQSGTGAPHYAFRLMLGSGMVASILLGFTALRHGDVAHHLAWMTRACALALGAGTQVFTQGFGNTVFGTSGLTTTLMMGAGWAIHLATAEFIIRRSRKHLPAESRPS
ncbi:hypothetical protein ART_0374 [Arthrobacter sp. PAMC 25486]|uniref:DUF2306 domain-containing protein n=1 Tax=Arthrobacter sp. PAMC 25486 TaxID=1494608 RepID=UPI000535F665|nr:DUF2306 domain-containing protein [Arthrobacter sp. PAMC 25486]AIX99972.1 hypothetical protein ART_0374 [Arthrobacter sp. PAMC 25486]